MRREQGCTSFAFIDHTLLPQLGANADDVEALEDLAIRAHVLYQLRSVAGADSNPLASTAPASSLSPLVHSAELKRCDDSIAHGVSKELQASAVPLMDRVYHQPRALTSKEVQGGVVSATPADDDSLIACLERGLGRMAGS